MYENADNSIKSLTSALEKLREELRESYIVKDHFLDCLVRRKKSSHETKAEFKKYELDNYAFKEVFVQTMDLPNLTSAHGEMPGRLAFSITMVKPRTAK